MDLTPAWSHSHQSVQEERGWVGGVGGVIQKNLLFLHFFVYISAVMVVLINSYFTQTLISPGDDSIVQKKKEKTKHYSGNIQVAARSFTNKPIKKYSTGLFYP